MKIKCISAFQNVDISFRESGKKELALYHHYKRFESIFNEDSLFPKFRAFLGIVTGEAPLLRALFFDPLYADRSGAQIDANENLKTPLSHVKRVARQLLLAKFFDFRPL